METEAAILYNSPSASLVNNSPPPVSKRRFRGALIDWRRHLAEGRKSELLIPISLALTIFLQTVAGAYFIGRLAERVDTLREDIQSIKQNVGQGINMQVEVKVLAKELETLRAEQRLLRDYTEGRISDLPYRRSIKIGAEE